MADFVAKQLYFDPDQHPEETLKAFDEFIKDYTRWYAANYPDPPKVSMDSAIQRWKLENADAQPSVAQFDVIKAAWQSKDKVKKFIGLHSSRRFFSDWEAAEPDETVRDHARWNDFVTTMQTYYKPTENITLKKLSFQVFMPRSKRKLYGIL